MHNLTGVFGMAYILVGACGILTGNFYQSIWTTRMIPSVIGDVVDYAPYRELESFFSDR
jgi:hypothetical protein